ncbi:MAG: outer membrane beta-barrel protein [Bacteroidales bacterium]|jgi:hypothetical protein|nr:outer membrane beta-barrel protein [Bacteroidales bacterium]
MKTKGLILLFLFLSLLTFSQFEQKVSINISAGMFKTFGYETGEGDYDPLQMPHYRPGPIAEAGIQYNINRRLSVMVSAGIMYSGSWSFMTGDYDYLHYTIFDPETEEPIAEGINKLNLFNLQAGIFPKFYLFPSKKWNPYLFAGISMNFTSAKYTNNWWKDADRLGVLGPDDEVPYDPFLEKNNGLGFIPGLGVEYGQTDRLRIYMSTGYYLIALNEKNFKNELVIENFNAFFIQLGVRLAFLKSKDL